MDNHKTIKTVSAFGLAVLADRYIIGEQDLRRNAMYGAALSTAIFGSDIIMAGVDALPIHIPTVSKSLYDGKTLTSRIVEVGSAVAVTQVLNSKVLGNDVNAVDGEFMFRAGVTALIDFYLSNFN